MSDPQIEVKVSMKESHYARLVNEAADANCSLSDLVTSRLAPLFGGVEHRTCECGSAWFVLAPGQVTTADGEGGTVAGAVCIDGDNEVTAWSGILVCNDCHKVADPEVPSRTRLALVAPAYEPSDATPGPSKVHIPDEARATLVAAKRRALKQLDES